MTLTDPTLDALLARLDQTPDDRLLLLVIADRSDEVGADGSGWRAIHRLDRWPHWWSGDGGWGWVSGGEDEASYGWARPAVLPSDWFDALTCSPDCCTRWARYWRGVEGCPMIAYQGAADAFLRLPADRRLQLLEGDL